MGTIALSKEKKGKERKLSAKPKFSTNDLCNTSGMMLFLLLLLYFLIMRSMNMHEIVLLRLFNAIFLAGGIILTLAIYKKHLMENFNLSTGFRIGMHVTAMAVVPFALFIGFYLCVDDHFMQFLQTQAGISEYIGPFTAALIVCAEGLFSGAVISFLAALFFRKRKLSTGK